MDVKGGRLKKFSRIKTWVIISIGVFLFACATTRDVQTLDREIDKLYSELDAFQKEKSSLENKISKLSDGNQKLKTELLLRLDKLQSELQTLSTSVEEYKDYFKRSSEEIDRVKEDVEGRLRALEEKSKILEETNKALEEKNREMEQGKKAELEELSPTKEPLSETKGAFPGMGDLYKDAYEAFQKGDLEGARKKFEAFLKEYPNGELSGNAQFWIAETYYHEKNFEKAILEYEKVMAKYPESGKIPVALFKQALAFLELGDKTNARNLLNRVIGRFPDSDQAKIAKKKMEAIKRMSINNE
jgi:tol-pal system protein YbgF